MVKRLLNYFICYMKWAHCKMEFETADDCGYSHTQSHVRKYLNTMKMYFYHCNRATHWMYENIVNATVSLVSLHAIAVSCNLYIYIPSRTLHFGGVTLDACVCLPVCVCVRARGTCVYRIHRWVRRYNSPAFTALSKQIVEHVNWTHAASDISMRWKNKPESMSNKMILWQVAKFTS